MSHPKIGFLLQKRTYLFAIPVCVPVVGGERPDDHLRRPVHVGVAGEGVDLRDGNLAASAAAAAAGCCCVVAAAVFGLSGGEQVDLGDEGHGQVRHASPVYQDGEKISKNRIHIYFKKKVPA